MSPGGPYARLLRRLAACLCSVLSVPWARAHLVTTGLGPIYDGVGHFVLSPEDVLLALAVAWLAGLHGPAAGRSAMVLLPLGWVAGGLGAGASSLPPLGGQIPSALTLLLAGVLIAADGRLPRWGLATVAFSVAACHGFYNGLAMREAGWAVAGLQLLGVAGALFVIATLFAALVVKLRFPVARIAVRVAGSWTAAVGLLCSVGRFGCGARPSCASGILASPVIAFSVRDTGIGIPADKQQCDMLAGKSDL